MALSAAEIEELILFRDAVLPAGTVVPTASGDWPTVAGRENFRGAVLRRAVTTPGTMIHRPDYGGGLADAIEAPASEEDLSAQIVAIEENLRRDPRVGRADVTAVESNETPGRVLVQMTVTPLRSDDELREVVGFDLEV